MSGAPGVGRRLSALARRCRRLTEWQRIHKPDAITCGIFAHDYELVANHPQAARQYGFVFDDARICIDGHLLTVAGQIAPRITPAKPRISNAIESGAAIDTTPGHG